MTDFNPNVILSIFTGLMVTIIGFFFHREREIATIAASLKALHERLDRIERVQNGKRPD